MHTQAAAAPTALASTESFVSIESTRALIGQSGRPAARQTVLASGLRGELDIRLVAGRFVVTLESIRAYRVRHGLRD